MWDNVLSVVVGVLLVIVFVIAVLSLVAVVMLGISSFIARRNGRGDAAAGRGPE